MVGLVTPPARAPPESKHRPYPAGTWSSGPTSIKKPRGAGTLANPRSEFQDHQPLETGPDSEDRLIVCLAISSYFPSIGGAEVTLHNLAIRLIYEGHRAVVLVGFPYWWKLRDQKDRFPYEIRPLPPKQNSWLKDRPGAFMAFQDLYFAHLQRTYGFDMWHSFGTWPVGVSVAHFTTPRDIPHVVRSVGYDVQKFEDIDYGVRLDPDVDALIRRWIPTCSKMVALSESVVTDCKEIGVPKDRVVTIPCAVELDRFESTDVDRSKIRKRHDVPTADFVFLAVGRNHPKKGFDVLVEAASILVENGVDGFHVAFAGKDMDAIRKQAADLGITDRVTILGEIGDEPDARLFQAPPTSIIELYKAADAVVFPSLLESFGNVQIEAMAAEVPLISTDAPGCRDVVQDGENGLVAAAGDSRDLARKMDSLIHDTGQQDRLVAGGRRTIREHYTWDTVIDAYLSAYMEAVRNREASAP